MGIFLVHPLIAYSRETKRLCCYYSRFENQNQSQMHLSSQCDKFMIKCSRSSSPAVMLCVIYDHHVWQDLHRSALDLCQEKPENLTTILHSQELIWLPDVSNFTVIQRTPPKPHLKHHSQLQVIAERDKSEFPPQAAQSTSSTAVALEYCEMGPPETQTCPANSNTGT